MKEDIEIIRISKSDDDYLNQLEKLFYDYYVSMNDKGLILDIVEDGGKIWRKYIEMGLGRSQIVVVALSGNKVIGFTWGYIHFSPPYLGNLMVGTWNGLYILSEHRNLGLSKLLYLEMEKWFHEKNVHSVEAQVLVENVHSIAGMKKMGYKDELFQTRKCFETND
jgi:hypothetical protein